jgi:AraC-like DNA-binding protein
MTKTRQQLEKVFENPRYDVVAFAFDLPHRHQIPEHEHSRDQLVYAQSGVMTVMTAAGTWVVPPNRAVWMPAGVRHWIRISGRLAMRTLYLRKGAAKSLPRACIVVSVSPLLRELILQIVDVGALSRRNRSDRTILDFLHLNLCAMDTIPLHVPMPQHPTLRAIAERLSEHPAESANLSDFAGRFHMSERTLERLFLSQTGLTFRHWRQQIRLLKSQELLAAGKSVTTVALDVGYESTSAFIAAFRKAFSQTPRRYVQS